MLKIGNKYTKKELYSIFNVPDDRQGGNWDTGYTTFNNSAFIFANVGIAGRTGHNYGNYWDGNNLIWFGKLKSHLKQPSIQFLLSNKNDVHFFTRIDDTSPFTYEGLGYVQEYWDTNPVKIRWRFKNVYYNGDEAEQFIIELKEGSPSYSVVNRYERNELARRICIERYGYDCSICNLNFADKYGEIGTNFIHVHHLIQLSSIGEEYVIDPINDLRPVCPNCHAMIHKRNPPFTIDELKEIMKK